MGLILLVIFIVIPLTELSIFITLGDYIGLWSTLILVFFTALIGSAILRHQGFEIIRRIRIHAYQGRLIADDMIEGLCLLVAGALLITPGFLTDSLGFALLVQPIRRRGASLIIEFFLKSLKTENLNSAQDKPIKRSDIIIEGEFEEVPREKKTRTVK